MTIESVGSSQTPWSAVTKTRLNSSKKFYSKKLSFGHKKESEHSFELFLSICVFYRRIFNLKMQNFLLENHYMLNARQTFCWRMTSFTKEPNPLLPYPLCGWPFDFCGGGGYGWFSSGKNVFPKPLAFAQKLYIHTKRVTRAGCTAGYKPLELEIFPLAYERVRIFFCIIYVMTDIFFQCRILFSQVYPCKFFTHNLLRSQIVGP